MAEPPWHLFITRWCGLCNCKTRHRVLGLCSYYGRYAIAECSSCSGRWRVRLSKHEILSYRYGLNIK